MTGYEMLNFNLRCLVIQLKIGNRPGFRKQSSSQVVLPKHAASKERKPFQHAASDKERALAGRKTMEKRETERKRKRNNSASEKQTQNTSRRMA
jgi:hypothetical protein